MADPLVVGVDAESGPGWAEARSVDEIERLVRAGRTVVVTPSELARSSARVSARTAGPAENTADTEKIGEAGDDEAAELAAAAVCAWLGARVFRTARPDQVRLAVAMTESLAGRRPPALARRGLA
jgi:hypothetical protein